MLLVKFSSDVMPVNFLSNLFYMLSPYFVHVLFLFLFPCPALFRVNGCDSIYAASAKQTVARFSSSVESLYFKRMQMALSLKNVGREGQYVRRNSVTYDTSREQFKFLLSRLTVSLASLRPPRSPDIIPPNCFPWCLLEGRVSETNFSVLTT